MNICIRLSGKFYYPEFSVSDYPVNFAIRNYLYPAIQQILLSVYPYQYFTSFCRQTLIKFPWDSQNVGPLKYCHAQLILQTAPCRVINMADIVFQFDVEKWAVKSVTLFQLSVKASQSATGWPVSFKKACARWSLQNFINSQLNWKFES